MKQRHFRSLWCLGLSALTLSACGTSASSGVAGEAGEAGELPSLRESRTIGCAACSGPEALSVIDMALRDDGSVVVVNEFEPHVRIFDPAGALVIATGKSGEGPGELQYPGWVFSEPDGSFHVFAVGRMQFAGYASTGEPLGAVRYGIGLAPVDTEYDVTRRLMYFVGFRPGEGIPMIGRIPFDGSDPGVVMKGADLPGMEPGQDVPVSHFALAAGPNGELAVGNGHRYRLAISDPDTGETIPTVHRIRPAIAGLRYPS